ncbi:hypothetical protein GN316_03010 [Xylophilus sp. Kf1]|nr:hypothetical protein [Xylophilus sp. Kf1]
MRFELNGYVVVSYRIRGSDDVQALTFAADEFSGIDTHNGLVEGPEPVYRGVWAATEENIVVRLTLVATRDEIREKVWEISPVREMLDNPCVDDDRIHFEFVEEDARH